MGPTKYIGIFNWNGEIHRLTTYASTYNNARMKLHAGLARKLGITKRAVDSYFYTSRNNETVEEAKE